MRPGETDRKLYRHGITGTLVGFDLSPDSIEAAQKWAKSAGIPHFEYRQADLNEICLEPASFDLIVAEMSLHHTVRLERLMDVTARALKPGGLLLVDNILQARFQWTGQQMQTVNGLLAMLPPEYLKTPDGIQKPPIERLPVSFFEETDPSEAVRSGEVISCLEQRFNVLWKRPYGGTILHPLLHDIACNFHEQDLFSETFLGSAIQLEETMMLTRQLDSDFIILLASPK